MLEKIKLYKIHVFEYSKREGTVAAKMENQVLPEIKKERSKKIIELSNRLGKEIKKTYIGREVNVLVEEKQKRILDRSYRKLFINWNRIKRRFKE